MRDRDGKEGCESGPFSHIAVKCKIMAFFEHLAFQTGIYTIKRLNARETRNRRLICDFLLWYETEFANLSG